MKKSTILCAGAIAFLIVLMVIPAFSQEENKTAKEESAPEAVAAPAPVQTPVQVPAQEAAKTPEASIYGEVQAVNASTGSITVQYYDYDNDEEKTLEITVDKDTKLENVKAIDEMKKGDWVDVNYMSGGGKNTAKMVSVEKEEPAAAETAPAAGEE
jgi:hypothetical protein